MIDLLISNHIIKALSMGNNCCTEPIRVQSELEEVMPIEVKLLRSEGSNTDARFVEEQLDPHIRRIICNKKPFEKQLASNENTFIWKNYANGDRYFGQVDHEDKPKGIGRLFKHDGSIVIGCFQGGVLNGEAFYANKDGLACQGIVVDGVLNCQNGLIESPAFKYIGGIENNMFSGKGILVTLKSRFEGRFEKGKKVEGKLSWISEEYIYVYEGRFDDAQKFTGTAILIEPYGEYIGEFLEGEKHGKGKYIYSSHLCFEGTYSRGKKEGYGTITNKDGTLSYQGGFKDGLPHGRGKSYRGGVLANEGNFIDGIFQGSL